VGKPEGEIPLERSRRRWMNNMKMDFKDVVWCGVDWIYLVQVRDQ
jgi:hypothetical protein